MSKACVWNNLELGKVIFASSVMSNEETDSLLKDDIKKCIIRASFADAELSSATEPLVGGLVGTIFFPKKEKPCV